MSSDPVRMFGDIHWKKAWKRRGGAAGFVLKVKGEGEKIPDRGPRRGLREDDFFPLGEADP
jgi:hypothetical protein